LVGDYSRAEAATRAGVDPLYIDGLVEHGIITPDASGQLTKGDVFRAQMARTLETGGVPTEGLAAAIRDGRISLAFFDAQSYERFPLLSDETFQSLSNRTGLPVDLLMLIREAIGGAVPDPDDQVREDELAIVPVIESGLALGFTPVSIARRLRVLGDAMRRVAETAADAYRSDLTEPMLAAGASNLEISAIGTSAESLRLTQAMDDAVVAIWNAQAVRPWTADIIANIEKSMADAGLLTPANRPPAICFLDITGYTRITHERGDEAAADLADKLGTLVHRSTTKRGGRAVKWLGDGVMMHFREVGPAVLAALELVDGVASAGLPPAHVGIHAGPVLSQGGDYYGQTVNLASRIADYARPGEVLVTQEVVDEVSEIDAIFTAIGPAELKGVSGAIQLHAAHLAGPREAGRFD
jgi:class 3 adenylate cyclase